VGSLIDPIERVVESTEHFVRTPSLRVLGIATSSSLREAVLRHVCATELLDANMAPFFVLEAPTEPGDDGWSLRCEELRADWAALGAGTEGAVAPLWRACAGGSSLERFALELRSALGNLPPQARELVVVLAPVWVRDPDRWRADLTALFQARGLEKARFVVVETEHVHAGAVLERLGARAEQVEARIDEATARREADARLEAMRSAPPGAPSQQLMGAAGPPSSPPIRPGAPMPLDPEARAAAARAVGAAAALLDPSAMRALAVLVLGAASAMRDGKFAEAVRLQRAARDACVEHQLSREAVMHELVLGAYVLQGGSTEHAIEVYRGARRRAEASALPDLAVQAQMAIGACLLTQKRPEDAVLAYAEAGRLVEGASATVFAIEAYRMSGQLLASLGRSAEATTAFRRALEVGEQAGDDARRGSTMPEAARQLAALCRRHGLVPQAESLDAQASALEAPRSATAAAETALDRI
jgi:tetratricopeptide (TPR) repeat protein